MASFFEERLYRRLELTQSCLDTFDRLVSRQRALVDYICFHIELASYAWLSLKISMNFMAWLTTQDSSMMDDFPVKLFPELIRTPDQ
jgi:hypothetical protein